jgi:hypothetical protein
VAPRWGDNPGGNYVNLEKLFMKHLRILALIMGVLFSSLALSEALRNQVWLTHKTDRFVSIMGVTMVLAVDFKLFNCSGEPMESSLDHFAKGQTLVEYELLPGSEESLPVITRIKLICH